MLRPLVLALAAATLAACASTSPHSTAPATPAASTILISIDGFRANALQRGHTPNLDSLARHGVRAEYMRPSYPSLTFPNHYTLVTGLRPDHHGIVHNTMDDPQLGHFNMDDDVATATAAWWGSEPIWSTVEKSGQRAATMFWPGSAAPIGGVRPTEWRPFDDKFPGASRVDAVLGWLDRPEGVRPKLITLYFEDVDHEEHDHGPGSAEDLAAETRVDGYIGRLRAGLASRGLADRVNIVVVSDHGMAPVAEGHTVTIEDMASPDIAANITTGQSVGFRPLPGHEAEATAKLVGRHDHYECWTKETLPARWQYGTSPRVPPIVCQMDEGWDAVARAKLATRSKGPRGSHGFDPALPSMRALFVADGPSFRDGVVLPPIDNVDVYPMLARVLGVTPMPNDGNPEALAGALRPTP
ncbi:ectonucleotide pyrophosphatase/phosphodiesterase [Cognatilysobacter terrigena]|uniref:alkaline phosphatase family protein n=1 Tax=Cognatilysobacter terrigena TaxID=2488749 RepID=UPI001FE3AE90|nr:ectonucleotide pyrophosphatase/phosphodiesterase [Lysobacter terrigena]